MNFTSLINVLLVVPVFLVSLSLHEFAHAWVAVKLGDPTPRLLGRLTLRPLVHADMVGTLMLPTVCIYLGWPFIGWARPVPVDAAKLRRRDLALVAAAGPLINFALAGLALSAEWAIVRMPFETNLMDVVLIVAITAKKLNLMLGIFNLIPIPPLDGFQIAKSLVVRS